MRRTEPVAAVSLAKVVCAPGGFRDYLGRRTAADGTEEELYGRAAELTLALDIYAPRDGGESAAREIMERLAEELAGQKQAAAARRTLVLETKYGAKTYPLDELLHLYLTEGEHKTDILEHLKEEAL